MGAAYDKCVKLAQDRHQEGFTNLLMALRCYRHPLPHLSEYCSREARLMVRFLEVLLDQLYPRAMWEKYLEEMQEGME